MVYLARFTLLLFTLILLYGCANHHAPPSAGAKEMPGAEGTIVFKPDDSTSNATSWWIDSDGIAPDVAGCHIGTNDKGVANGRMFAEACLANGLLVESNPAKGQLHSHKEDTGHPDTFNCNNWCKARGKKTGTCEVAPAPPCGKSARCVCK